MREQKQAYFDNPDNIRRLLRVFYAICALLVILDLVIHRHTEFRWEGLPAFYPLYGFVGCVVLVFAAKWMRTFLMRPEDYYDKREFDREQVGGRQLADSEARDGGHPHV